MGSRNRRSRGRNINGIFLLDKPQGLSSNQALQEVKKIYKAAKAGHTGSLDPMATGMLPICFGEATKISSFLLDADKTYLFRAKFGQKTDSGDADGELVAEQDASAVTEAVVESALEAFRGDIQQIPPMYSALHHNGVRLYELARQGIEVEREPRPVSIYKLELEEFIQDDTGVFADISVTCSKGTYVRTLAEDIAASIGNIAHLVALRRTEVGQCKPPMITIDELQAHANSDEQQIFTLLKTVESTVTHWPSVELDADTAAYIKDGHPVQWPDLPLDGLVRLREEANDRFIGIGEIEEDGRVAPKRLIRCA